MPTVQIIQGHVLDTLRQLPNQSVHCCITSPPYWGLRAYKTEPQVWPASAKATADKGGDKVCEHVWGADMPKPGSEYREGLSTSIFAGREDKAMIKESFRRDRALVPRSATGGQFCQHCGAWRGELGSEPTPELYVEHLVQVFREVWRVLRKDGSCWVNIGDSYAGTGYGKGTGNFGQRDNPTCMVMKKELPNGLKPKDLCGMPWRLAFALQADGWWLRSDVIWHKPNPMPESCTDRPTKSHEYVFLLTKSARYYYDAEAVRETGSPSTQERGKYGWHGQTGTAKDGLAIGARVGKSYQTMAFGDVKMGDTTMCPADGRRNLRTVWTISTEANPLAHFATFPRRLVEPCILAGSSERGVCPACGAPWARVVEASEKYKQQKASVSGYRSNNLEMLGRKVKNNSGIDYADYHTTGFRPTCACVAADPVPATVLDPFSGTGTTGIVAVMHGRAYVGLELNSEYVKMSLKRIRAECGMLAQIETEMK